MSKRPPCISEPPWYTKHFEELLGVSDFPSGVLSMHVGKWVACEVRAGHEICSKSGFLGRGVGLP